MHAHLSSRSVELRNRIYDFASEDQEDADCKPRAMKKTCKAWNEPTWKFFGLIQTCQQIRAEYRPLWLRNLTLSLSNSCLKDFVTTFLSSSDGLNDVLKRVKIEWRGRYDENAIHDLTQILQLRACSPTTSFLYGSYTIFNEGDTCSHCFKETKARRRGKVYDAKSIKSCTCTWVSWESYQSQTRFRLVQNLIRNDNPVWQSRVLANQMSIGFYFVSRSDLIVIRIRCEDNLFGVETSEDAFPHAESARKLLETWGLFDLPAQELMKFHLETKNSKSLWVRIIPPKPPSRRRRRIV
jgi:hypothetical protein